MLQLLFYDKTNFCLSSQFHVLILYILLVAHRVGLQSTRRRLQILRSLHHFYERSHGICHLHFQPRGYSGKLKPNISTKHPIAKQDCVVEKLKNSQKSFLSHFEYQDKKNSKYSLI